MKELIDSLRAFIEKLKTSDLEITETYENGIDHTTRILRVKLRDRNDG